jgi:hypothetical protein
LAKRVVKLLKKEEVLRKEVSHLKKETTKDMVAR